MEAKALSELAAERAQGVDLRVGFHALSDHVHAECLGHAHDAGRDRG